MPRMEGIERGARAAAVGSQWLPPDWSPGPCPCLPAPTSLLAAGCTRPSTHQPRGILPNGNLWHVASLLQALQQLLHTSLGMKTSNCTKPLDLSGYICPQVFFFFLVQLCPLFTSPNTLPTTAFPLVHPAPATLVSWLTGVCWVSSSLRAFAHTTVSLAWLQVLISATPFLRPSLSLTSPIYNWGSMLYSLPSSQANMDPDEKWGTNRAPQKPPPS